MTYNNPDSKIDIQFIELNNTISNIRKEFNNRLDVIEKRLKLDDLPLDIEVEIHSTEIESVKKQLAIVRDNYEHELEELKEGIKTLRLESVTRQANSKTLELLIGGLVTVTVTGLTIWGPVWLNKNYHIPKQLPPTLEKISMENSKSFKEN